MMFILLEIKTSIKDILNAKYLYKNSTFCKTKQKKSVRKVATGFSVLISICCDMCFD